MLRRVALVRIDVSEELSASFTRVLRIGELGTTLAILVTLIMEALNSFETSVLRRATRRNIPEDAILHSHRHEHHRSYIEILVCNERFEALSSFQGGELPLVAYPRLLILPICIPHGAHVRRFFFFKFKQENN
jgi:hypothetical protein